MPIIHIKNDRKSNVETVEAQKFSNKQEIKRIQEEHKEFKQKLTNLQRSELIEDEKYEDKVALKEVFRLRKIHNDLLLKSAKTRNYILDNLKDSVKELELNSHKPHLEDNALTQEVRLLNKA